MDPEFKSISIVKDASAGGIVCDPSGGIWVTDKQEIPADTPAKIYYFKTESTSPQAYTLPPPPPGRGARPQYLALQLDTGGSTVVAVWVSDLSAGAIYRVTPGATAVDKDEIYVFDATSESTKIRHIVWDGTLKKIYVTDEEGDRIISFTPPAVGTKLNLLQESSLVKVPTPGAQVSLLAVAPGKGVWYSGYTNQVGFLSADTMAISKTLAVSGAYGIALTKDGKRLWVTSLTDSQLYAVDPADKPTQAKAVGITHLDDGPREIVIDRSGYLWVTLQYTGKVAEITPDGLRVKYLDIGTDSYPGGIVYDTKIDRFWVSDEEQANGRILTLTPINDPVDPTGKADVIIKANPLEGWGDPGSQLTFKVITEKTSGAKVGTDVTLSIPESSGQFPGADQHSQTVTTDKTTGEGPVTLDILATAQEGDDIPVSAQVRGIEKQTSIYTGHVGSHSITKLEITNDPGKDRAYPKQKFPIRLEVVVTAPSKENRDIEFKITKGNGTFSDGSTTKIVKTDSNGHATLDLMAGDVYPEDIEITATARDDTSKSVTFKKRYVSPIPSDVVWPNMHLVPRTTTSTATAPIKITGKSSTGATVPVSGLPVTLSLSEIVVGVKPQFKEKGTNTVAGSEVEVETDDDGMLYIGNITGSENKNKYYVYALKPGQFTMSLVFINERGTPKTFPHSYEATVT